MKKNYFSFLMVMVCIALVVSSAKAQIVGFQFSAPESVGNEVSAPVSYFTDGLTVTDLSRGAGWTAPATTLPRGFVSSRVGTATDTTGMVAQDMYFGFNITVNANYKASLSNIIYKLRLSSSAGAKLYFWKYSLDGVNFNKANDPVDITSSIPTGEGVIQPTVNLSGISALQDVPAGTTIYLRLYAGNSGGGSTAIGRSASGNGNDYVLSVGGSVENTTAALPVLGWQLANPSSDGNETSIDATQVDNQLNTSTLVRGAGLNTSATYSRSFSAGANVASTNSFADTAIAIASDMYYAFNVSAKADHKVSLAKLNYKVRRSGGGSQVWYWKYSVNGTDFFKLAEPFLLENDNTYGVYAPSIDLSAITGLQDVASGSTVYFRLYVNGSNNSTGSTNIGVSDQYSSNSYVLSLDGMVEGTLPVKLTSFSGSLNGNNVRLNWQTASEKNNDYFEVLKLNEDKSVVVLGKVFGTGTTTSIKNYSFTDKTPTAGTNYYQLRQVDVNGNIELSEIIAVKSNFNRQNFSVSLDSDRFNVFLNSTKSTDARFLITDTSGKILHNQTLGLEKGENLFQVPAPFQQGTYIITVVLKGEAPISTKILR